MLAVSRRVLELRLEALAEQQHEIRVVELLDVAGRRLEVVRLGPGRREVANAHRRPADLLRGERERIEGRDDARALVVGAAATAAAARAETSHPQYENDSYSHPSVSYSPWPDARQADYEGLLAEHGLRPTRQRVSVLGALASRDDATAQQIHALLADDGVRVGPRDRLPHAARACRRAASSTRSRTTAERRATACAATAITTISSARAVTGSSSSATASSTPGSPISPPQHGFTLEAHTVEVTGRCPAARRLEPAELARRSGASRRPRLHAADVCKDDRRRRGGRHHGLRHGPRLRRQREPRWRALFGAPSAEARARIVTKGGMRRADGRWIPDGRAKAIRGDCEASLAALDGLEIDLYLIHAPDPGTPWKTSVRALARLVDEGLVKRVGVANVNRRQLDEALELAPVAAVQVALSVLDDSAVRGGVVERCEEAGVALSSRTLRSAGRAGPAASLVKGWPRPHSPGCSSSLPPSSRSPALAARRPLARPPEPRGFA